MEHNGIENEKNNQVIYFDEIDNNSIRLTNYQLKLQITNDCLITNNNELPNFD